jgi:predicted transcriptional regulator
MYLIDYINEHISKRCKGDIKSGEAELATRFGVSPRAITAYRLGQRHPGVEIARNIVKKTRGKVDYEGVYAPYKKAK